MASPVVSITISYHKPGTQPPLFVAGTFSDPQWSPQEMEYITDADGEHRFKKELSVPPDATIQYKFRIGHGNWWVLDESVSAVTDESGNRNNLVKAPSITDVTSASSDQSTDSVTITSEEDSEAMNNDPPLASGGGGLMDSVKAELGLQEPTKLDRRAVEKLMQGKGKTEGPGLHTFPVKSNHVENGDSTKEEAAPIEAQDAEHSDESPCQANSDSNENLDSDAVLVQADTPTTEIEAPKIDHMAQEPIANAAKEILGRADPQSGRSTPNYVKTAAEVADSAALLDKEASEPDISDGEAGRIGYRRLSSTPIPEVATTAAEVADSAQILDKPQPVFEFEIRSAEYDDYIDDDVTYGDHKPPLFSHECVGMVQDSKHEEVHEANDDWAQDRERGRSSAEYDVDRMDLNDPTLENFPSRRAEILSTVRKIETGLGEDYSYYEGVPPSPVVGTTRRGANDILGDPLATSPIAISPVLPRSQDRLRVSRSPHGSTSSLSLQSISEAEEPEPPEETFPRSLRLSPGKPQELGPKTLRTPDSDEDEGVAMKAGVKLDKNSRSEHEASLSPGEAAVPPTTLTPEIPPEPVPDSSDPVPEVAVGKAPRELPSHEDAPKTPKTILEENDENNSPRIVLQPADETPGDLPTPAQVKSTDDSQARSLGSETDATATSTQLSKRIVANAPNRSRPGTPASIRSNQLQADKDGWFSAFFRVLFDWIGGIISKLVGKR